MPDFLPSEADLQLVGIQNNFTAGTENLQLLAAPGAGFKWRIVEGELSVRTNTPGAMSTITFKSATTAVRAFQTSDGRQVLLPHRPRGYCDTSENEALQVNASVANTVLSGQVLCQKVPI